MSFVVRSPTLLCIEGLDGRSQGLGLRARDHSSPHPIGISTGLNLIWPSMRGGWIDRFLDFKASRILLWQPPPFPALRPTGWVSFKVSVAPSNHPPKGDQTVEFGQSDKSLRPVSDFQLIETETGLDLAVKE
jgi:hypothetical protein